ncbi:MAG TPA: branched-chain amino acid ABC transporter permease [Syntrophales bacterium]|nr:branched-chain amino acid ABC transporter permease [Syntrophales bacterium]HOX94481.1 branched-chain amino acid ABC transporter permease [Syntrophales bacterium]HPN25620.1 branched-chain amino acid ABC transporter permease [Syntrophales bacterium]HQM28122.1 branched-chain amino acid ABC transporter permease [Syntrophales bacterium]
MDKSEKTQFRRERLDRGIKARTDTIYAIASFRDMLYLILPRVLPLVLMVVLPLLLGEYWRKVVCYAAVYGLLALSWDFLGAIGLFSLGQALFFGVGAYMAGALNLYFEWPIYYTLPAATLGGALFCTLLLTPVIRLKGVYFAMVTIVIPILFSRTIVAGGIFGGTHGIVNLTPFKSDLLAEYLILFALIGCLFAFRRVIGEDYGLVMHAIRDDDRAVMSAGINIYWRKVQALFVASAVGCLAGAFMCHNYQFVGPSAFSLDYSLLPLAAAALGGPGTFVGAVLGSAILIPLSEALRDFGGLRMVFYCLILIASMILLPEGIFHYIARKYHQFERTVKI